MHLFQKCVIIPMSQERNCLCTKERVTVLTKTQTLGRLELLKTAALRMNGQMRACAAWSAIEEHDKILDMACGEGALLQHLSEKYRLTVCGMCDSPDKARIARERLGDADVVPGRLEDIPWRNDTFDIVMLPSVIRGDARRIFDEALRVLKEGGQMTVAASIFKMRLESEVSRRELMRLMQEAGFQDVTFRTSGFYGAISGWKKRQMPC